MKKVFPIHGIIGIIILLFSEVLLFKRINPFYSWFYCFSWWSYILIIDAIIYLLKGNSLILNRTKEFFLMIPWSIFIWLIFEAANLSLENWYYINLPHSTIERWMGYAIAYGTVLPGLFETTEFLESIGLFKNLKIKGIKISSAKHTILILFGIFCLVSSILIPQYFFSLIWIGFIFLLDPLNYRFGNRSLLRQLEEGKPMKIYCLLVAGLICGILWEFWNFWALSKWIYTVPFFEELKGFEMPLLGFLGFPPFSVEAYVMYETISLFRFGRGWEEFTYNLNPQKKTRLETKILMAILFIIFFILIFSQIDKKTVDSYYPRLKDAYWIEPSYREKLPKAGILTIEELVLKTREKRERDELALRLLVPKEKLHQWIEKSKLVLLKGIGIENLKLLESAGVHSVYLLASEDPERLFQRIKDLNPGKSIPKKAKVRIWIKEAKKAIKTR
jgi:hypothetical protein